VEEAQEGDGVTALADNNNNFCSESHNETVFPRLALLDPPQKLLPELMKSVTTLKPNQIAILYEAPSHRVCMHRNESTRPGRAVGRSPPRDPEPVPGNGTAPRSRAPAMDHQPGVRVVAQEEWGRVLYCKFVWGAMVFGHNVGGVPGVGASPRARSR
jgi:hypothetical protein